MATKKLEPEVVDILSNIKKGKNFLLSGGAGSGKTYSLVSVINEVIKQNPTSTVACMTYTNAAAGEISARVNHLNLKVSTTHDFLWDMIKMFQSELKETLLELINNPDIRIAVPETNDDETYFNDFNEGVQYKEYLDVKNGIISHDEVILLGKEMFKKYKKLCDILKDKYKFIFIDEYQDTNPLVVNILLDELEKSKKKCIIGFFGDSMQSIYDNGIGDLNGYIDGEQLVEVQKKQNRRNPQLVIKLANKIRTDGLTQEPSNDTNATNMNKDTEKIKQGSIKFLYSTEKNLELVKEMSIFKELGWDFSDSKETKELNLTHNLIANKAGFEELMEIYDRDPIISLKNDIVQRKINSNQIIPNDESTFEDIVDKAALIRRGGILRIDEIKNIPHNLKLYNVLKDKPFSEVRRIYIDKDSLIDDKKDNADSENKRGSRRDILIKQLFKIQTAIQLYENGGFTAFINATDYQVKTIKDKKNIFKIINDIKNMEDKSIEEVIAYADRQGLCKIDDRYTSFIEKNYYLYYRVSKVKFKVFQKLFAYLEGFTPFSTQHKVKGSEYDNVLVVLDNGNWNSYNFKKLFGETGGSEGPLLNAEKIFYVCCTRAKENLVVYFNEPSEVIIKTAKEWFGKTNVIDCDKELS
ncbi:UvrD-helicase domain-containing protein [Carnobacterium maltaromaticum]|uniref:UvrD-helicase domain-containing protein n=1 Tax=Carnobacterium maltaromaticum TaxID=2751 RepID=UPI00295E27C3|nr:UvrD-helicase domain-containing protein [Carnobacterium maltaromaticum]